MAAQSSFGVGSGKQMMIADIEMDQTAVAAYTLAEFFATTVERKLSQGYRDLYCWEQRALDWLRDWRKIDEVTPINMWTQCYLTYGPPPWRRDQV